MIQLSTADVKTPLVTVAGFKVKIQAEVDYFDDDVCAVRVTEIDFSHASGLPEDFNEETFAEQNEEAIFEAVEESFHAS